MLISCGAALFGLRLAIRSLGYLPVTELLPDPAQLRLMARVRTGAAAPPNDSECQMLDAVPHRHTHRGPFAPGPLPARLLAGLQHDALAEGATLALVTGGLAYDRLERIAVAAARRADLNPRARAEIRRWTSSAPPPPHPPPPAGRRANQTAPDTVRRALGPPHHVRTAHGTPLASPTNAAPGRWSLPAGT
jgi:hypothetical protein